MSRTLLEQIERHLSDCREDLAVRERTGGLLFGENNEDVMRWLQGQIDRFQPIANRISARLELAA